MGIFSSLIFSLPLLGTFPTDVSGPVLYALHHGKAEQAFDNYLNYAQESHAHDFALLQQAAKTLLEQGIFSKDPEIQLMCMFGAGIANSSELISILEKGIKSDDLRTQLTALTYLGKQQDDEADKILLEAISSPFLITRLEALLQLAKKNHPAVLGHLYSLSVKVPDLVRGAFAQIAVHLEGVEASRYLHKLLTDTDVDVRVETILTVASAHRDDFLPYLHTLATGASGAQQEAIALAFGELKDHSALNRLNEWKSSKQENIKLAALIALCQLGDGQHLEGIVAEARHGSLFAIAALGKLKEGRETLLHLLTQSDT